jgi:glycosyltransferase involved in cell wall biosynthesis
MPPKRLSLITINYQNLPGLKATILSVLAQIPHRVDWEWIVIDGGSTDGSTEYLAEYKHLFSFLCSEPDQGIYDAMNKGLHKAQGDFVWFLNSGDRLHGQEALFQALEAIERYSEVDCFYTDTLFVDEKYRVLGPISRLKPQTFPENLKYESFRFGMNICHQSFIVRRSLAPDYQLKYRLSSDIDWILAILKKKPRCMRLQGYLSEFQTGGSSSQNNREAVQERYHILKEHFGFIPNVCAHLWIAVRRFFFRWNWKERH